MTTLYNCRHSGDQYRITKFDHNFDVESSYLCTATECECPAGHRPMCRHREMLSKFLQRDHVGDEWFFDYDRGGWVQGTGVSMERAEATVVDPEEELAFEEENDEAEVEPALELSYRPDAPAMTDEEAAEKALEAARDFFAPAEGLPPLPDGVTMIHLGALADIADVHNAIAEAVGEPTIPTQPMPTTTSPQPALAAGPPTIRRRV